MMKQMLLLWILATIYESPAQTDPSILGLWKGTMMLPGSIGMASFTFHITPVIADSTATIEASEEKLSVPVQLKKTSRWQNTSVKSWSIWTRCRMMKPAGATPARMH
jgi:hypothetical protein